MPATDIFLIRHAETDWNVEPKRYQGREDVPISPKARSASLATLSEIDWDPFDCVVSSPAIRCRQTLELAKEAGFAPDSEYLEERLWEIDNGWYSGKTEEEIRQFDESNFESFSRGCVDVPAGGGESIQVMADRVKAAVQFWLRELQGRHPIFFVHGGPIRCLLGSRDGFQLDQFHSFRVPNLSLWKISTSDLTGWEHD